jgi:hypothetical protein
MEKAFNVAQAAAKYATLNEDGTVALNVSDPAVLGVSGKYLADMSAAIDRINSLVRSGELVIGADLSLKATAKSELLAEVAKRNEEEVAATRGKNNVDWYLYPYPGAFMLYFSTTDLHRYFSQNCGCLALLVASMCGYMSTPYLSPMLTRLFVYNPYFFRCCPSPFYSHGLYLYVPIVTPGRPTGSSTSTPSDTSTPATAARPTGRVTGPTCDAPFRPPLSPRRRLSGRHGAQGRQSAWPGALPAPFL